MDIPADHPPIVAPRVGVLLINLGTPDAPTPRAVRRYLAEFLSDRRVVELPALLWQPILRTVVLGTRPKQSAHAYAAIWTPEGSPLATITAAQSAALGAMLGPDILVDHAMRYGEPNIAGRLAAMKAQGCERILVAPLYPQYSGATTGTANDAAFAALMRMRWQPAIRTLPPWHDHPHYIGALKDSLERQLAALDFTPEQIVASFHSMPVRTLLAGDPYHCHCMKTARLLSEALGRELMVSFQSKLGRARWLEPSTESTLDRLGRDGVTSVAVITPGFVADNLETLEEIAIRGRETFVAAGGSDFALIECLNTSPEAVKLLRELIARELEGWVQPH